MARRQLDDLSLEFRRQSSEKTRLCWDVTGAPTFTDSTNTMSLLLPPSPWWMTPFLDPKTRMQWPVEGVHRAMSSIVMTALPCSPHFILGPAHTVSSQSCSNESFSEKVSMATSAEGHFLVGAFSLHEDAPWCFRIGEKCNERQLGDAERMSSYLPRDSSDNPHP